MLTVLGLRALWFHNRGEQAADWQGWARESGLGLSFAMPPGRVVTVFDTRIDLDNPAAYRAADYIALYPDGPPPAVRLGDGPVLREGRAPAPFTIRENHGGSGGTKKGTLPFWPEFQPLRHHRLSADRQRETNSSGSLDLPAYLKSGGVR